MAEEKSKMTNILLEAGTNELEIVEFMVGPSYYGINVAKVREIIRYPENVIEVPNTNAAIEGIINLRGNVIPIINLARHLGKETNEEKKDTRIIVCEFNKFTVGFWVSSVARIHRLSWKQIESPSEVITAGETFVTAVVRLEDKLILLLDFEKITADINPACGMEGVDKTNYMANTVSFDRSTKNIIVAEDSPFIRNMIVEYLTAAGYQVTITTNGKEAWDIINGFRKAADFKNIADHINLMITDIEMPQMDGLHLIKNVKSDDKLKKLPCIVFSSLINEELSTKCQSVGADGEITKPEIAHLVELVDKNVL